MTDVAVASTSLSDHEAGEDLAKQIRIQLGEVPPDAVIVFASAQNDYEALLRALDAGCCPRTMVGASSAGEFTSQAAGTGHASAIALRSPGMRFTAALATDMADSRAEAARELVAAFHGVRSPEYRYRTAIVLVDALAGHAEALVDELTLATGGMYQFVGGGAGDDGRFHKTHVFFGTSAFSNAAVALEVLSDKPIGIAARHGWSPCGDPLRVTESSQSCMVSLNISPAIEAFEDHAAATQQAFDRTDPMPFFLHNIVGVETPEGHKLRVPLGVSAEGGIVCAAEVPTGATAHIMSIQSTAAAEAAAGAVRAAVEQVERTGSTPRAALFFDCVATRLRLGKDFAHELEAVGRELGGVPFAGFNSYGQIVRAEGQFSGFHNCTAVVCVFPD